VSQVPPVPVLGSPSPPRRWRYFLLLSLLLNLFLISVVIGITVWSEDETSGSLEEHHHSGDKSAKDKIAIIRVAGVLMDGSTEFVHQQVRKAAMDRSVKAVVLRIESPGGTITASEDLHRLLVRLRDNTHLAYEGTEPKPITASMGSIAASGGYYIAMPANRVLADTTTITGSIGVFAALPNVSEFASKHGIKMELIRAGNIKAGGSPLQPLRPEERQPWQDMIDEAYDRFVTVVAEGRKNLTKEQLREQVLAREVPVYNDIGLTVNNEQGQPVTRIQTRYRADGGTFTPTQALELDLIDEIGDIHAALRHAANSAGLTRFEAVSYKKEPTWAERLIGIRIAQSQDSPSISTLAASLTPRVWYLAPGYEVSATLSKH
jgi:protease IV